MRSKEKIAEEIVLIRYYNVLFYLFFKTGMDDFKRQCLIKKIDGADKNGQCQGRNGGRGRSL